MAKFKRKGKGGLPAVSTASLPDIIFMLLFFFMVSTVMRETSINVNIHVPGATEIKKLEKKSLVSYIYIGEPKNTNKYGTEPRIQLNDSYAKVTDIRDYITTEREKMDEKERPFMTTSLKVDDKTRMGVVTDVKQALRRSSALKINYSTRSVENVY
ncbi:MAG: biopolymer transporter ExbD [Bacteroidota bacterium]|nr:biopolymer transporter ExbD [Bacteroidota bacterium]